MNESYIKVFRRLLEWEWYNDSKMVHLFIHLLLKANYTDGKFKGILVKRGQLITGRNSLSDATGISTQSIRTCLDRLISTNELTIESTNSFSLITIVKYEEYQFFEKKSTSKSTSKLTNDQQTDNQQLTTIEEGNKDNNKILMFESFWFKYPNKVGKAKCLPKFLKLTDDEIGQIVSTLPKFIAYKPFESYSHPNPETYLNQRRWEDEIPEIKKPVHTPLSGIA